MALRLKEVCCKVALCKNCQRWSCQAFICLSIGENLVDTDYWFTHLQNVDFQSIFARSSSAITPGKNGSIDATRKSTARFQM